MRFTVVKEFYSRPLGESAFSSNLFGNKLVKVIERYKEIEKKQEGAKTQSWIKDQLKNISNELDLDWKAQEYLNKIIEPLSVFIHEYGSDIKSNELLDLLVKTEDGAFEADDIKDKIYYIFELYKRFFFRDDEGSEILNQSSLYTKDMEDFKYIVNALAILTRDAVARKYFADTSILDTTQFFDKNKNIKSKKEIASLIDTWYKATGKKIPSKETEDDYGVGNKFRDRERNVGSIEDLLKFVANTEFIKKAGIASVEDLITILIRIYFNDLEDDVKAEINRKYGEKGKEITPAYFTSNSRAVKELAKYLHNSDESQFTLQSNPDKMAKELFLYWERLLEQ